MNALTITICTATVFSAVQVNDDSSDFDLPYDLQYRSSDQDRFEVSSHRKVQGTFNRLTSMKTVPLFSTEEEEKEQEQEQEDEISLDTLMSYEIPKEYYRRGVESTFTAAAQSEEEEQQLNVQSEVAPLIKKWDIRDVAIMVAAGAAFLVAIISAGALMKRLCCQPKDEFCTSKSH